MQEGTLYRHILKEAWDITWRNKPLWVLGFLAVFWGDLGAYQSLNAALGNFFPLLPWPPGKNLLPLPALPSATPGGVAAGIAAGLIVLALLAAIVVVATAGRGGLLLAIAKRRARQSIKLSVAFSRGARAFWTLLAIGILAKLDILLSSSLLTPLVRGETQPGQVALFVAAFVAVTLVSLVLAFLGIYASALVMIEGYPLRGAIAESVRMFARNWLVSMELALLLYAVGFIVGLALLIVIFVVSVPFILAGSLIALLNIPFGIWLVVIPALAAYIMLLVLIGSAFVAFQYTTWVLLFMRLRGEGAVAKTIRLTARFGRVLHRKIA